MTFNSSNYLQILENISKYSTKNVKMVAVSKNHSVESIKTAINSGIRIFGENRVQEAEKKFTNLKSKFQNIELHLTGPLQTNKVKNAIKIFDLFQTLDREKLAKEFSKHTEFIKNKTFFIQVNIGGEKTKSGILPEIADDFIIYCRQDLKLNITGLMCIPPINKNPKFYFKNLNDIAKRNNINHLSMGMSNDYIDGLKCGASYIRVGTLLFGNRNYDN
tara:strand:- start:265 stop:918 length:654 start_codon:yes stop_codon:yes gene_type:complete